MMSEERKEEVVIRYDGRKVRNVEAKCKVIEYKREI